MSSDAVEHVIERPGCRVHYWLAGAEDRPLVVFMHGATMDHRMFDEQVNALLPHYRFLTWDARGHGKSQPLNGEFSLEGCADDLLAVLDAIGVEKAVIGGQSLGGYIAQHIYLRAPARVQAMVIIGSTCIAFPYKKWEVLALKASMPLLSLWPYSHFTRTVARTTAIKAEVRRYALEAISQIARDDFLTIWKAVTLAVNEQGLPGHYIRVPLLMVHGDHDTTGSIRKLAPVWAAYEPDMRYEVIPHAGHNANQDNPVWFNRLLLEFLRENVPV